MLLNVRQELLQVGVMACGGGCQSAADRGWPVNTKRVHLSCVCTCFGLSPPTLLLSSPCSIAGRLCGVHEAAAGTRCSGWAGYWLLLSNWLSKPCQHKTWACLPTSHRVHPSLLCPATALPTCRRQHNSDAGGCPQTDQDRHLPGLKRRRLYLFKPRVGSSFTG